MKVLGKLLVIAAIVVVLLSMATVALADDATPLPADLSELATPAGLGVVVVVIVGLLKRAPKVGKWIKADGLHAFAVSIGVAGVVLLIVHLVQYFGIYDLAQGFWANFTVAWGVSQMFYNTQKVGADTVKTVLDL